MSYKESRAEITLKMLCGCDRTTSIGFSAYSPDVSGCYAAGDSLEETRRNAQEALQFHFDGMRLVGEPIPEPASGVDYVEVPAA